MIQFRGKIKDYNKSLYQEAFNYIKHNSDELKIYNNVPFQTFLLDNIPSGRSLRYKIAKMFYEIGFNIFNENFICAECFSGSDVLKIEVPKNIEMIGSYCFENSQLEEISFEPGSKLSILGYESLNGTWIKSIILPENFQHLDGSVFYECDELEKITINKNIQSIGSNVFYGCDSLKSIDYKGTKDEWFKVYKDKKWLNQSSIKEIICSDGVLKIN